MSDAAQPPEGSGPSRDAPQIERRAPGFKALSFDEIQSRIAELPTEPGVYVMRDRKGVAVYVGKAVNLRSRVRSYFNRSGDNRWFVAILAQVIGDIETILTDTEKQALILENNLIKTLQPRFNVELKDDKNFLVLKLSRRHAFPRLEFDRKIRKDGARYFGPYHSAGAVRETLRIVNRHFGLRTCTDQVFATRRRPCLQYQIKRCPAPCVLDVPAEDYADAVDDTQLLLEGRGDELLPALRGRMKAAARELRFEDAARYRDKIKAVERTLESQRIVQSVEKNQDVIGFFREGEAVQIQLLAVRRGKLVDSRSFTVGDQPFPDEEVLSGFLLRYYDGGTMEIPAAVLLPFDVASASAMADWLSEQRARVEDAGPGRRLRVKVSVPRRGDNRRMVEMANRNAEHVFRARKVDVESAEATLERLRQRLGLRERPRRMECYDISTIQGAFSVGSQVVFENGLPEKSKYRHYRIKGVEGQNDFASMEEVLSRRIRRGLEEGDLPDLIVIDGGIGQLNVAVEVLADHGVEHIDLCGLAKERSPEASMVPDGARRTGVGKQERVFLPGRKNPIVLRAHTQELFLMTRLRDETHRFAITYHRKLRRKETLKSGLDDIPGIGPQRRNALLRHFGSLKAVRAAGVEALAEVKGMGRAAAERVHQHFNAPQSLGEDS